MELWSLDCLKKRKLKLKYHKISQIIALFELAVATRMYYKVSAKVETKVVKTVRFLGQVKPAQKDRLIG